MGALSSYEQGALDQVEQEKLRRLAKSPRRLVPAKVKTTAKNAGRRAKDLPGAEQAAQAAAKGYAKAAEGMGKFMARSSQFTLSSHRVLRAYRRNGHTLENLADIHELDLQVLDRVARFKRLNHIYASAAAVEGAGSGAAISGGTLLAAGGSAGAGAGAAPGLALVSAAVATDAAAVLIAASRVVAHTGLYYGYNPEDPKEEIFMMSVISLGAASTQGAKMAAYSELSRVTQMLARSAPWVKLNTSVLAKVSQKFATKFGQNLTKKKLGQFVPLAGIAVGAGMNYTLVDNIADAAYWSYRERFLRDKLGEAMAVPPEQTLGRDDGERILEEPIDVLKLLESEGINTSADGESGV